MDRRTLIAIILCFGIFLGWQKLYIEPRLPKPVANAPALGSGASTGTTGATSLSAGGAAPGGATGASADPSKFTSTEKKPLVSLPLHLGTGTAMVGSGSRIFTGWDLKSYKLGITPEAGSVDMQSVTHQPAEVELAFDSPELAYVTQAGGDLTQTPTGLQWVFEDANLKLTREISAKEDQNWADVKITAEFKGASHPKFAFVSLLSQSADKDPEAHDRQLIYWTNDNIERTQVKESIDLKEIATPVKWVAASSRYFLMSILAGPGADPKGLLQPTGAYEGRVSLVYPIAGNTVTLPLKVYFGPKELDLLRTVDPTLDHTVDFGWFTVVAYPLLRIMKWFYALPFVGNWGVAIILLTLLVRIATFPLAYKSMKSMKQMSRLQPQLAKLREKYKNDKETLNREMLGLMRTHGYNPAAGCLPIVIQMPVFFALYRVAYSSIELYHAHFAGWIVDLSAKDPFYITPVLLTLTMFIQQKLTPNTATDPAQQKMMQFMPIIFGVFMIQTPAGVTLYMLVSAIAGIGQQLFLNRRLNVPTPSILTPEVT